MIVRVCDTGDAGIAAHGNTRLFQSFEGSLPQRFAASAYPVAGIKVQASNKREFVKTGPAGLDAVKGTACLRHAGELQGKTCRCKCIVQRGALPPGEGQRNITMGGGIG